MTKQTDTIALIGRVFIGVLFLSAGLSKLADPATTQGYIAAVGLPAPIAAYFVALTVELGGGVLLIAGFQVRIVAAALAVFTLATAVFFHNHFADQNQMIHFMKNIAILGGLLQVVAFGAGRYSLDHRFGRATTPSVALSAAR